MNPEDGSRKRKSSQEHKAVKDYKRFTKQELLKLINKGEVNIEEIIKYNNDNNI
jgi:hypothetical protein